MYRVRFDSTTGDILGIPSTELLDSEDSSDLIAALSMQEYYTWVPNPSRYRINLSTGALEERT